MLALTIVLALISLAVLIAFRTDFRKRSATIGVRSPLELENDLPELAQHIRETDYVWQEESPGVYVGVLDRGFGHRFLIVWRDDDQQLILSDDKNLRIGGAKVYDNVNTALRVFGPLRVEGSDLRAKVSQLPADVGELRAEIIHQVHMEQSRTSALPGAQTR